MQRRGIAGAGALVLHGGGERLGAEDLPRDDPAGAQRAFPLHGFDGKEFLMPAQGFDKDILRIFNREGVHPDVRPTAVDDATVVSMV